MEDRELIVKTSAYIDRHRDEMLSLWEKIVSIESGTPDKEGVDRVGAEFCAYHAKRDTDGKELSLR